MEARDPEPEPSPSPTSDNEASASNNEGEGETPASTPSPSLGDRVPSSDETFESVYGYKPSESPEEAAKAILNENLIPAIQTLCHLASYGSNEKIRLDASKYVIERCLGKLTEKLPIGDMWESLFRDIATGR